MSHDAIIKDSKETMSYRGYLFLLRISEIGSNILQINKGIILKELISVYKEMSLNEIEISLLSIYLDRFGWNCRDPLEIVIHFTAYAAKCYLNENVGNLESILLGKYIFFTEYPKWMTRYRSSVTVGYVDINYMYIQLSSADITAEEIDYYDYNQAVIQLIETSTKIEKIED